MNGGGTRATPFDTSDSRSLGELLRDTATHGQQLVRSEIDLTVSEMSAKAKAMAVYIGAAAAAGVLAVVALLLVGHTIAQVFDEVLGTWLAYLITAAIFLGGAAGLGMFAKAGMQKTSLAPKESIETAQEDVQWLKRHM